MSTASALNYLQDLIALPSVNPMGRETGAKAPYLEGRVTDYLDSFFQRLGVPYKRITVLPGRDNLIASFECPGAQRTLLWDVHQDTVPVEGMTIDPFSPQIEGGKLFGRGASDVKGSMAAMLSAFERLVRERPQGSANILLACTVDEEYTHRGSSALGAMGLEVDLAIVAEPTMLQIVNAHKGAVRWKAITRGKACHSSRPSDGINAIYRMARVLEQLELEAERLLRSEPDPILGTPTLSVGRIEGGQSVNIVPDYAEVQIDRRVIPGEAPDTVREELLRRINAQLPFEVEFGMPWVRMPALSPKLSRPWLDQVSQTLTPILGKETQIESVPFGTDAGPLAAAGIPSIVLGPGDIAQAHTKDEWIEVEQLERAVEVYYGLAVGLGSTS